MKTADYVFRLAPLLVAFLVASCSSADEHLADVDRNGSNADFIIGADISVIPEQENLGFVYIDSGVEKDIFEILKDHGFNYIRLRIFHDPGHPNGLPDWHEETRSTPYNDLGKTLEMAKRAKAAGMGLFLDFHYSDTWAYPAEQRKPAAWAGLGFDELKAAMCDYTRATLIAFQDAGVLPDMVQVGNEITTGILWPDGAVWYPDAYPEANNWDQLAQLLTAGCNAVKSVDPQIKTVLHIDGVSRVEEAASWVGEVRNRNVPFDVLGVSAYEVFDGQPSAWEASLRNLSEKYPALELLISEYASHYREANDIMFNLPNGAGTFIWEPTEDGYWGEGLFDVNWETMQIITRNRIQLYDQMVRDYGLTP